MGEFFEAVKAVCFNYISSAAVPAVMEVTVENIPPEVENILNRTLLRVSDSVDKRQGSIIYDALAPACAELAQVYIWIDEFLNEAFADTASRDYLVLRAKERGLEPYGATYAVLKGVFNCAVPIGSRFNLDRLNYAVTELIDGEAHTYRLRCETAGAEGNRYLGTMTTIDYIDGLTSARLAEVLIRGEDEEDTEVFRQRYFDSLNTQAFGGNVADYKQKVKALDGVGQVRVYNADEWNGGGTVKLVITDTENGMPSTTLISAVQEAIDPLTNQGKGVGIAPVGHIVTVVGVNTDPVDVSLSIQLKTGYTLEALTPYITQKINGYFAGLNAQWESIYDEGEECIKVVTARLASDIHSIPGIENIKKISANSASYGMTYKIEKDCLAVLGELTITEVTESGT